MNAILYFSTGTKNLWWDGVRGISLELLHGGGGDFIGLDKFSRATQIKMNSELMFCLNKQFNFVDEFRVLEDKAGILHNFLQDDSRFAAMVSKAFKISTSIN